LRTFKIEEIEIKKKAILTIATDGLLDKLDKDNQLFGDNQFIKLIILNANNHTNIIENSINQVVDNWIRRTKQFNDMLVFMFHLNLN